MTKSKTKNLGTITLGETKVGDKIQFIETPEGRPIHNPTIYTRVLPTKEWNNRWLTYEKDGKEMDAFLETDDIRTKTYKVLLLGRDVTKKKGKENQLSLW